MRTKLHCELVRRKEECTHPQKTNNLKKHLRYIPIYDILSMLSAKRIAGKTPVVFLTDFGE